MPRTPSPQQKNLPTSPRILVAFDDSGCNLGCSGCSTVNLPCARLRHSPARAQISPLMRGSTLASEPARTNWSDSTLACCIASRSAVTTLPRFTVNYSTPARHHNNDRLLSGCRLDLHVSFLRRLRYCYSHCGHVSISMSTSMQAMMRRSRLTPNGISKCCLC